MSGTSTQFAFDVLERADPSPVSLERIFSNLPAPADDSKPGDILPLDHYDRPESGYSISHGYISKWIPVYERVEAEDAVGVIASLGGSYTPRQLGWRIERRLVSETCQCKSGTFKFRHGHLIHMDGCGRAVGKRPNEDKDAFRARMASLQQAPSDEYLNGVYPTLGGFNAEDPKSHITKGRSEYREKTKGMVTWGSSSKDDASWNGGTLRALEKVESEQKQKREEKLKLAVETYSKKQLPRQLNEL